MLGVDGEPTRLGSTRHNRTHQWRALTLTSLLIGVPATIPTTSESVSRQHHPSWDKRPARLSRPVSLPNPAGELVDRVGGKQVLVGGLFLTGLSIGLVGFATSYVSFLGLAFLSGHRAG